MAEYIVLFLPRRASLCNKVCVVKFMCGNFTEGTTVDILTGTNEGRVAIGKATILKVCGVKFPHSPNGNLLFLSLFSLSKN